MNQITAFVLSILLTCVASAQPEKDVDALLSRMHEASKNADVTYFDLFADDAVFFGTDLWERWTKDEFAALYKPYMESGRGWEFKMRDRRIALQPCGTIALFDEALFSDSFGPCRGSGAARLDDGGWRIVRYHLDITVPNDVVDDLVPMISEYESSRVEVISLHSLPVDTEAFADLIRSELPDVVIIGLAGTLPSRSLVDALRGYKLETVHHGVAGLCRVDTQVLYRTDRFAAPIRATHYGDAPGAAFEYLSLPRQSGGGMPVHVTTTSDPKLQSGARSAIVWHEYFDEPDRWSTAATPDADAQSLWVPDTIEVTELETFRVDEIQIARAILTPRESPEMPTE